MSTIDRYSLAEGREHSCPSVAQAKKNLRSVGVLVSVTISSYALLGAAFVATLSMF